MHFDVRFGRAVRMEQHHSGTLAVSHGPLLYALPIDHEEIEGTSYGQPGFYDIYAKPITPVSADWRLPKGEEFVLAAAEDRIPGPFDSYVLTGRLYNGSTGRLEEVELVPMGGTVLRQVSFCPVVEATKRTQ